MQQKTEKPRARRNAAMADVVDVLAHDAVKQTLFDAGHTRDPNQAAPGNLPLAMLRKLFLDVSEGKNPWSSFFFMGEPDHARLRDIVGKPLLKRIAAFKPNVDGVVDDVLASLDGRDGFDLVAEYATPIPVRVIAEVVGVGDHDLPRFRRWADDVFLMFNAKRTPEEHKLCVAGHQNVQNYFMALLQLRKTDPADDLVSELAAAQAEGAPISDDEIVAHLKLMLTAGHMTTTDLIGSAAWLLLSNPDQRAKFRADPSLIHGVVEEALRHEPPVTQTYRIATRDGEIGGCPYAKGDMLSSVFMFANRDPNVFDDPGAFDITRKPNPHLSFGGGAHVCLGAPLARLEVQSAIAKLFQRFPNLRLAHDGPPEWKAAAGQRGLKRLDVLTG